MTALRTNLIHLASKLTKGSTERKALLEVLAAKPSYTAEKAAVSRFAKMPSLKPLKEAIEKLVGVLEKTMLVTMLLGCGWTG